LQEKAADPCVAREKVVVERFQFYEKDENAGK